MKHRKYQYGNHKAERFFLAILLMSVGLNAHASSVNANDTVSIAKDLDRIKGGRIKGGTVLK